MKSARKANGMKKMSTTKKAKEMKKSSAAGPNSATETNTDSVLPDAAAVESR